jgi:Heterokaryon incompatibility protein Het-C
MSEGSVVEEDKTQFAVFGEPSASDPTHSMISKDHFDNILNEPAGRVAQVVVEHTVNLVVAAWSDQSRDIGRTLDEVRIVSYVSLVDILLENTDNAGVSPPPFYGSPMSCAGFDGAGSGCLVPANATR